MPVNKAVADKQFEMYAYARDHGHNKYVQKDKKCHEYLRGEQWDPVTAAELARQRKPNLTINKTYATIVTALGIQLNAKADTIYRPVGGLANDETATALSKVFKHIHQRNKLQYKENDLFQYGIVGSRSYYDCRVDFDDRMMGHAKITRLNGRNVVLDPEASEYDPSEWNRVFITKWLVPDEIERIYSKKDAKYLAEKGRSSHAGGYDSIDDDRPTGIFGQANDPFGYTADAEIAKGRRIRVIEHQFKVRRKKWHFVDPDTGETTLIPKELLEKREAVAKMARLELLKKEISVIHWRVTADDVVLHNEESPYPWFTVVPYFPILDDGTTMGIVEHILDPQDQLNKTESQILHVVNTTSNSGWKTKKGNIKNMTPGELEMAGAKTGLVLEVEDVNQTEKIQPNQIPTGLENFSNKVDNFIKEVGGVSDSLRGFDRADVAAKAITEKKSSGAINMAKYLENLDRTRFLLAERVLWIIQNYYTEERMLRITSGGSAGVGGKEEELVINQQTPEGRIANDMTIGEYSVTIASVPARDVFEDTQFQQAVQMRLELGIQIPDEYIIEKSSISDKAGLLELLNQGPTPEQQELTALELEEKKADIAKTKEETREIGADIVVKLSSARANMVGAKAKQLEAAGSMQPVKEVQEVELKERQQMLQERQQRFSEQQHRDTMKTQAQQAKAKPKPAASK